VTRSSALEGSREGDLKALGLVTLTWAAAVAAGLLITRSELPGQLRRRLAPTQPEPLPESRETRELFRP